MQKSKVVKKRFGILIIDGIKMRPPAEIENDRPGQLKISYKPKEKVS
jgi:hypothetical protein